MKKEKLKKYWFTFGQQHVHSVDSTTFDKDIVVEIEAEDYGSAREKMFKIFGLKWAFQYEEMPKMDERRRKTIYFRFV